MQKKVVAAKLVTGKGCRAVACGDGSYTVYHDANGQKGARVLLAAGVITGQAGPPSPRIVAACMDAAKTTAKKAPAKAPAKAPRVPKK